MRFHEVAVGEEFKLLGEDTTYRRLPPTDNRIWGHNRCIDIDTGTIMIIGDPVPVEPFNYYCGA